MYAVLFFTALALTVYAGALLFELDVLARWRRRPATDRPAHPAERAEPGGPTRHAPPAGHVQPTGPAEPAERMLTHRLLAGEIEPAAYRAALARLAAEDSARNPMTVPRPRG